ncbi:MAG: hypothetical protein ACR2JI_08220 [Mycobacterium sp.]
MAVCPLSPVLTAGAATLPALERLAGDLDAPLRVGVRGRPGAGVRTVVRALQSAGTQVCAPDSDPELEVRVVVETFTAEDLSALSGGRPTVVVLNKADLIGFTGAGPMVAAFSRCVELRRRTGIPVVPLSALVALAALDPAGLDDCPIDGCLIDGGLLDPLRELAEGPARLSARVRGRLLTRLDLFGIATAVAALRDGADRIAVRAALRRASGMDAVCAEIDRAAAPVRYRRMRAVLTELTGMGAGPGGARLARFVAGDDVVLARMAAAAEVLAAAGMPIPRATDPLRMAIHWQRYSAGPVSELHRWCGLDLVRGALRLWDRR